MGAIFGAITLIAFFAFAFVGGFYPTFVCNAMLPMGGAFALGCALSAAFLGGRAAADGSLGNVAKS